MKTITGLLYESMWASRQLQEDKLCSKTETPVVPLSVVFTSSSTVFNYVRETR